MTEKRDAYLFVRELQCPNIKNAASDMAKQDIKSGKELPIILLFRRWVDDIKIHLIHPKSEVVAHAIANVRSCGQAHLALSSSTSLTMLRFYSLRCCRIARHSQCYEGRYEFLSSQG
jgi:hypothetical protein